MATPEAPSRPIRYSFVLILVDCILAVVVAVRLLFAAPPMSVTDALGWLFVVLAVYLASLLVP